VRLLLLLSSLLLAGEDPSALLAGKTVEERLRGVELCGDEALLRGALGDREWEVVLRAAEALGGRGTAASVEDLVSRALDGPTRGIRRAAAEAAAKLDAGAAAARLAKRVAKDSSPALLEALALVPSPEAAPRLEKLLPSQDRETRRLALAALGALRDPGRIPEFAKLLRDEDPVLRAGAVDALVRTGDASAANQLLAAFREPRMPDVVERRIVRGVREIAAVQKEPGKIGRLCLAGFSAEPSPRRARMLGALGAKAAPLGPVTEYVQALRGAAQSSREADVRAACLFALAAIGDAEGLPAAESLAEKDASPRVRFHALRTAAALDAGRAALLSRAVLAKDSAPSVREEAAALLGRLRAPDSVPALQAALGDADWTVAVSAAVSLGKLRDPAGVAPLKALLSHKDWRLRGAAAAGLGWIRQKEAVDLLIGALPDRDLSVAWAARESLRRIAGKPVGDKTKEWVQWWEPRRAGFEFPDRDAEAKQAKKYGYAVGESAVYEDLDVVVLVTRGGGDNIQDLLKSLGIRHRLVRAASVDQAALHPDALLVANCPGEIVAKDVERISWFVRAGGYLFSSCWALTHTVGEAFPDIVKKVETKGQVIGTVPAEPVPSASPFVAGVFDEAVRASYELMGSHLLQVVDPERCEVIVDSPECAGKWGEGNLAAWFTVGHGLVLDSANHFDLQGMKQARLNTEEERMAFAVDRLGYSYAEARKLRDEGVFKSQPRAAGETRDRTIFRLITAFVRQKRIADQR
jgi:HEAT repeat protein